MVDFTRAIHGCDGSLMRKLSLKSDCAVLHMQRADGTDYVLRIYGQEMPVYREITGHIYESLPQVYRTCEREGFFVVEEEYVDGVSLWEMISCGARMDEKRTAEIGMKVCSAVSGLHRAGFIHRDIKPEHVLLTAEGRVVLIDLDAAMRINPYKRSDTQLLGTAMYAAPEQFGLTRSDERTDIFSIGILINEMLTGVHPSVTICRDGRLADIISRCIQMNPADRYQSAEELQEVLRTLACSPEKQPGTAGNKPAVKGGKVAAVIGAAALCLTFLLGISMISGDEPDNGMSGQMQQSQQEDIGPAKVEGTDYLQLYKETQRDTVYYNLKTGGQSAPLYTEDGTLVDQSFDVYVDEAVGRLAGWNTKYSGWTLDSTGCRTGAEGYVHAEKDGKHYAIPVVIMGEPMSVYSCLPDIDDLANGYMEPMAGENESDPWSISCTYKKDEPTTLYMVLTSNFHDLHPESSSEHVEIRRYVGEVDWPYLVYQLTFSNPEGGYVPFDVKSNYNTQVFRFYEE